MLLTNTILVNEADVYIINIIIIIMMMMMIIMMMMMMMIIIINCNWVIARWQWLYYVYTNMKKKKRVTRKFKSVGLHERQVIATWKLGNHLSIRL